MEPGKIGGGKRGNGGKQEFHEGGNHLSGVKNTFKDNNPNSLDLQLAYLETSGLEGNKNLPLG